VLRERRNQGTQPEIETQSLKRGAVAGTSTLRRTLSLRYQTGNALPAMAASCAFAPRRNRSRDASTGQRWTFRELEQRAAAIAIAQEPVAFPQGMSVDFVLRVLAAWRGGQLCCPLDSGQERPQASSAPQGIVHMKLTSATTGLPRLVAFTASQLLADAENIVETMGLRADWPNLGVISLAHSYGFSNLVTPLLLRAIPLVLCESPLPEAVRRAAAFVEHVTLPAVPALWRVWHEAKAIPANVRLALSAGAPLPLSLERDVFESTGVKIHNFYGATECGGSLTIRAKRRVRTAPASAPLRQVKLATNTEGCLEVRGPAVGETYWPKPEPNLSNGCYLSSDLVELTHGLVFAGPVHRPNQCGRTEGFPETIERILMAHPDVSDCLVFGAPSPDAGRSEIIVACVVPRGAVAEDLLKNFLLSSLPTWQVPREWKFVESLAPSARGKLSRSEWRTRLGYGS
jgi:acyl-CoA synthetase (AMP-forming)/AMP-acid ligase II